MEIARVAVVWTPFLISIAMFTLAVAAVARASASSVVRVFAHFAVFQALLAFIEWGYRYSTSLSSAQGWIDAGAVWPLSVATIWSFGWAIAMDRRSPALASWRYIMYGPALIFTILAFASPDMHREAVLRWWGYSYVLPDTILMTTALTWATASTAVIGVIVLLALRSHDDHSRPVLRAYLIATVANIAMGVAFGIVGGFIDEPIPELSTLGSGVFVVVIGYAVYRYGMWEFAPHVAAETVLQTMGDAVVLIDDDERVRYANLAAVSVLGTELGEPGAAAAMYLPEVMLAGDALGRTLDEVVTTAHGRPLHVSARIERMPGGAGGRVIVMRDTEEQIRHREQLSYLAFHDALTGLGNRELFFQRLADECRRNRSFDDAFAACVLIDLDRFKDVNDAYGHAAGDDVLIETAARLARTIRGADSAYRLGGDEYAILLREMRGAEDHRVVVTKLLVAFAEPMKTGDVLVPVSASIGHTIIQPGDSAEAVFARADAGLYDAKERRAIAVEFGPADELPQTRRAITHSRVRAAINGGHIRWHYQPIVRADGSLAGAEALARWSPDQLPVLSPAEFIPAAEEIGAIDMVGHMARDHAIALLSAIAPSEIFLSVNLSPRELIHDDLLRRILAQLDGSGAFSQIHLELTESQLMEFGPSQHRLFSSLAEAGVKFLIDDFGTGYSSITRLRELPVHGVKLDRSFLVDAGHDPRVRAVLEGTIRMVHGLELEIIAEGVETPAEMDLLVAAGCTLFQGYHFHRPMPVDDFRALVGRGGPLTPT